MRVSIVKLSEIYSMLLAYPIFAQYWNLFSQKVRFAINQSTYYTQEIE